ncbi:MAG: phage tail sheath subtilisin-like domain-containing protein [Laribacter sp.]|nr:phage tail sheath subtilisin-like domain-containing protein [Laribacter sp.]MBP9527590.1 phage tail sheath subtilisin-like domain-containing protein [Laribacter sp.]MBP9608548.1 phage tail sheath subtilisin-like domain-containing protein [Laribacter sp.]
MAANFLHGVETTRVDKSPRAVNMVKSAIIALIGTAPTGPVNDPTLCLSDTDNARFGPMLPGFSVPDALDAIYDQGAAAVIVVNVLDPATHRTAVQAETVHLDPATGKATLAHPAAMDVVVKSADGTVTHVLGTDYLLDALTGEITRIGSGAIASGATLTVAYAWADPGKVTPADIIGTVDAITGRRKGLKLLGDTYQRFGYFPKIIIAPGYASHAGVAAELSAVASNLGGKGLVDAPIGTTRDMAVAMRGPTVPDSPFNTSNRAAILCYPHVKVYDPATNRNRLQPLSARMAGVMAAKDMSHGYWWSPSNTEIKGIVGLELDLTARIDDPLSDVNLLNEAGIVTVFNSFGTGFRLFGNRNANFPSESGLTTFISCARVQDMIDESLRYASLQYADRPIDDALIDILVESGNQFMRKLIGDKAILDGVCWYDHKRQTETGLANGHIIISYKFTPPPPLERLTYESEMTSEYLVKLKGTDA